MHGVAPKDDGPVIKSGAIIDGPYSDGPYRYQLWRIWDETRPPVIWVMLNPSTADGNVDDPTIRRCMGFARSHLYGGIYVLNLFAYRCTSPKALWAKCDANFDIIGPENYEHMFELIASKENSPVIAAWGSHGGRDKNHCIFLHWYDGTFGHRPLLCLGTTKSGQPKHPLYVRGNTTFQTFEHPDYSNNQYAAELAALYGIT